jgi:hypothetical protein
LWPVLSDFEGVGAMFGQGLVRRREETIFAVRFSSG